ncbi:MAG: potassium transporter, partial [Solirubrobacteraceae bacterium]|nr:potassium transporter [Solirubrobacteraceae bacterium]
VLFFVVVRTQWKKPLWIVLAGAAAFLTVDLAFFSANLRKVASGGWFPLSIALLVFTVLITWQRGRTIVTRNREEEEGPLRDFVEQVHAMDPPVFRVAGTGVFLNSNPETTPLAMRANVEHNHALHDNAVILSVQTLKVPHVPPDERVVIDDLGYGDDGISHVTARFGFQDEQNIPRALALAVDQGLEGAVDPDEASYFLSKITIVPTKAPGMRRWRKKLFLVISRNAASPVEYYGLPDDRTVVMGAHIEV